MDIDKKACLDKARFFINQNSELHDLEEVLVITDKWTQQKTENVEYKKHKAPYVLWDIIRIMDNITCIQKEYIIGALDEIRRTLQSNDFFQYAEHAVENPFLGEKIMLLNTFNINCTAKTAKMKEIEKLLINQVFEKQLQNDEDAIDNVLMLQILYYMLVNNYAIEDSLVGKVLSDTLSDLSNVFGWKYSLVTQPQYSRKIHNSYHFSSPFILLYWLCTIQNRFKCLNKDENTILTRVLEDGYNRLDKLECYEIGILLSSTPNGYDSKINRAIHELMKRQSEDGGWLPEGVFFDYPQYGEGFIGSRIYTSIICIEGIVCAGKKQWETSCECTMAVNRLNHKNTLEVVKNKLFSNSGIIQMHMRNNCMKPLLEDGDEIQVRMCLEMKKGDIVVFRHYRGMMMAHRIIDIIKAQSQAVYITAADNGGLWGYPVFQREIIGKVIKVYKPHLSKMVTFEGERYA